MSDKSTNFRFAYLLLLLVFTPLLRFNTLRATKEDGALALQLATALHQRMAHDDFDGIYQEADTEFKDAVNPDRHRAWMAGIENRLGSPMACEQGETKVKGGLFLTRKIWSQCTTRFSKNSTAVETFVWARSDDQYRLYYYNLVSPDLRNR